MPKKRKPMVEIERVTVREGVARYVEMKGEEGATVPEISAMIKMTHSHAVGELRNHVLQGRLTRVGRGLYAGLRPGDAKTAKRDRKTIVDVVTSQPVQGPRPCGKLGRVLDFVNGSLTISDAAIISRALGIPHSIVSTSLSYLCRDGHIQRTWQGHYFRLSITKRKRTLRA